MAEIQTLVLGSGEQILRGLVRRVRADRDRERVLEHLADIVEGFRIVAHALDEIRRIRDRRRRTEAERVAVGRGAPRARRSRWCRRRRRGSDTTTALTELLGRARPRSRGRSGRRRRRRRTGMMTSILRDGYFSRRTPCQVITSEGSGGGQHRCQHAFSSRPLSREPFGNARRAVYPRQCPASSLGPSRTRTCRAASSTFRFRWKATSPAIRRLRCRRSSTCGIDQTIRAHPRRSFPACRQSDLPDGAGWALEKVEITTHNGTHLDAPWHYHPTMDHALGAPKPPMTIDQVPLDWCLQPGVKLDFRHFPTAMW